MGKYISRKVIDGHMTVTELKREKGRGQYMRVLIYAGETEEGETIAEWDMPALLDYDTPAEMAVGQMIRRDKNRPS